MGFNLYRSQSFKNCILKTRKSPFLLKIIPKYTISGSMQIKQQHLSNYFK